MRGVQVLPIYKNLIPTGLFECGNEFLLIAATGIDCYVCFNQIYAVLGEINPDLKVKNWRHKKFTLFSAKQNTIFISPN